MTPLYFGSSKRRLFGAYTPGRGERAAVLCPPWGNEYLAAHRSLKHLGAQLAAAGWHVLRFDYHGTGDSGGRLEEESLAGWERDVETAIEEARDASGAARVALAGLRLGATLAARVAARRPRDCSSLALWDPVVSGADYHRELLLAAAEAHDEPEVWGFPLGRAMADELRALALPPVPAPLAARTLAVVSTGAPLDPVRAALPEAGVEAIADTSVWDEGRRFGAAGLPVKVLQRIVEWLK